MDRLTPLFLSFPFIDFESRPRRKPRTSSIIEGYLNISFHQLGKDIAFPLREAPRRRCMAGQSTMPHKCSSPYSQLPVLLAALTRIELVFKTVRFLDRPMMFTVRKTVQSQTNFANIIKNSLSK